MAAASNGSGGKSVNFSSFGYRINNSSLTSFLLTFLVLPSS